MNLYQLVVFLKSKLRLKINPIRIRLLIVKKFSFCWYNNLNLFKKQKKNNNFFWKKRIKNKNISFYQENLYSKKLNWKNNWSIFPKINFYSDNIYLTLKLNQIIIAAFLSVSYFAFDIRLNLTLKKTNLVFFVFLFPMKKLNSFEINKKTNLKKKLSFLIQLYSKLKTKLIIFDFYLLLQQKQKQIKFRSQAAQKLISKSQIILKKNEWSFEVINTFFLLKSASFLAFFISNELIKKKKQHLIWLDSIEKILVIYWKISLFNKCFNGISSFRIELIGINFEVKGRLNGQDRKQKFRFKIGSVSLQQFNINVDYSFKEAFTRFGVLRVKVWLVLVDSKKKNLNFFEKKKKFL